MVRRERARRGPITGIMARLFDDASEEYLELDSAPVTAVPLSMACWAWSDDLTVDQYLMALTDKDATNMAFGLILRAAQAGDPIQASTYASSLSVASSSAAPSASTWFHAAGVWASATSRAAYLNGGNKGTQTTSRVPTGIDRISIARTGDLSPGYYVSGMVAEAAIWNVALSDAEVALLAAGVSPLEVARANLVAYWPLWRDEDVDVIGGYNLADVNTPSVADHPPLCRPPHSAAGCFDGPTVI
jgi:hypothetical protein